MEFGKLFIYGGIVIWLYVTFIWMVSLIKKDAGIMDAFWGPGFILVGSAYIYAGYQSAFHPRLLFVLVALWGIRLALHIGTRNSSQPEDARYAAWRKENGKNWWWKSYLKVFLLQGTVMWIVSLPLLVGLQDRSALNLLDYLGIGIWMFGFLFEAVGDWQLLRFKGNPANKGKVFDRGLWAYTRHPNYFGETVLWWGITLVAISLNSWWIVISPILMTFLLLKVSGVAMLDELLTRTKPQYRDYILRTNAFIPGLKK